MAPIASDAEIVERILCDLACNYATPGPIRTLFAFDREHGQFLLLDEGWEGYRRIYHVWAHAELRESKYWIHEDGTEEGIANLLVSAGVQRDRIVLEFHAPNLRGATDFAVA